MFSAVLANCLQLFCGILSEDVDSNYAGNAEFLNVFDMLLQIYQTFFNCLYVRSLQVGFRYAAVHLQRTYGSNNNGCVRFQAGITAFDIKEFFRTKVSAEACLGDSIISQLQAGLSCHNAVAAMGNISERTAVDDCRYVFQSLYQVRLNGILQQSCHCALSLNLACGNRVAVVIVSNDNFCQTLLEVMQAACQAKNSHNLGSNGNVKAVLTRYAVSLAAQAYYDVAQLAVVHIYNTLPRNTARVNVQSVALLDMVVQHCCQQHMCGGDSMEVTGKVQVDVLHRHNLRIAAACSAALNAHAWAEGRLAQSYDNLFAELSQALCQTYGSSGLAFACRSRGDSGNQNQLAVFFIFNTAD